MNSLINVFSHLLQASWQAGIIILLVLAVVWMMGVRLSPRWRCALWALAMIRLALPSLPASSISLFNLWRQSPSAAAPTNAIDAKEEIVYGAIPDGSTMDLPAPMLIKTATPSYPLSAIALFSLAWAAGFAALLAIAICAQLRLTNRLKRMPSASDPRILDAMRLCAHELHLPPVRVIESSLVDSPALAGPLHPTILLPLGLVDRLSPSELRFVLMHELLHHKRGDLLIGWLAWLIAAVHWFNPLAWLAIRCFRVERELSCDQAVLTRTVPNERPSYGLTILKILSISTPQRMPPGMIGMNTGRRTLARRIAAIASSCRPAGFSPLGPILFLALGCATLTGPKSTSTQTTSTETIVDNAAVVQNIYDVSDLLIDVADFDAPPATAENFLPATRPARTRDQLVQELIATITSTIDPFSWRDNTGQIGTISVSHDSSTLVVTQTLANQVAIEKKLNQLRAQRGVQATITVRFITLDSAEKLLGSPDQKWNEAADGSYGLWPQFLDDTAFNRLLRAALEQQESTITTAPRLTMLDGQRAFVTVATERAYVADIKPTANGFDPQIKTAWSGTRLDCRLQVSPDHKLATLNIRPRLQNLLGLTPVRWPDSPPGRTDLIIQVPQLSITTMDATITMPDKHSAVYLLHPQQPQNANPTTQPFKPSTQSMILIVRPEIIAQQESNPNPNSN